MNPMYRPPMSPANMTAQPRAFAILCAVVTLVLLDACGIATRTLWSVQAPSPDGSWIATARTDQTSGPGNADIETGVYVGRPGDSAEPISVLLFENQPQQSGREIALKLNWLTPSHLEVVVTRVPAFHYRVASYAGVQISVRQLTTGKAE